MKLVGTVGDDTQNMRWRKRLLIAIPAVLLLGALAMWYLGAVRGSHATALIGVSVLTIAVALCLFALYARSTAQRLMHDETELRLHAEALKLALKSSGRIIMRYDPRTQTLYRTSEPESADIAVPDAIPLESLIAVNDAREMRDFLDALKSGAPYGGATVRMRLAPDSALGWYRAEFSSIGAGKARRGIVSFFDIGEARDREQVYNNWENSFAMLPLDKYVVFEHDLNTNECNRVEGNLFNTDSLIVNMDFNARTRMIAEEMVCAPDRARFNAFLSREKMFGMFHDGVRAPRLDFRLLRADGGTRWARLTVQFAQEPRSREIKAYISIIDFDLEKRAELRGTWLAQTDGETGAVCAEAFAKIVSDMLDERKGQMHAIMAVRVDARLSRAESFQRMHGLLRREDVVGRAAEDMFAILLTGIPDAAVVERRADKILNALKRADAVDAPSIGIALYPKDGESCECLLQNARRAMRAGAIGVSFCAPDGV